MRSQGRPWISGTILFTGEHPELGIFLARIEHAGGWPTYVTAVLDGELVPLQALGDEAALRIAGMTAQIPRPLNAVSTRGG